MATYTTTEVFKNLNRAGKNVVLDVRTNGGSVEVQRRVGGTFTTMQTITTNSSWQVNIDDSEVQIVPTGGAQYDITT
ncbi:MAG: hypothetical protein ACRCSS_19470 [Shewanella sp.]